LVFIKAYLQGRADEPDYLIKCLIEHLENNIKKAIGDEPLDTDLISGKKRIERTPEGKKPPISGTNPKEASRIKRGIQRGRKREIRRDKAFRTTTSKLREKEGPRTATIEHTKTDKSGKQVKEQYVGVGALRDKKSLEIYLSLNNNLGKKSYDKYFSKLPMEIQYGDKTITITKNAVEKNKLDVLFGIVGSENSPVMAVVSRYVIADDAGRRLTGVDLIESMRGETYGKYNPKTKSFFDAKMSNAEADKLIAELSGEQEKSKEGLKSKTAKNSDILRVLSSGTGAQYQLNQLKKILNNEFKDAKGRIIPTKNYLKRLNEVALRYKHGKGQEGDDYLREYLENNPRGISASKEVFSFIIEVLQKIDSSSQDSSVKASIGKILTALRKKNSDVLSAMQRYSDKRQGERDTEPTMYSSSQVLSKLNKTTKSFWKDFSEEIKTLPSALDKVKGDSGKISTVLNEKLFYRGVEFIIGILNTIDKEVTFKQVKEQIVPEFENVSGRSVPEWMKGKKNSAAGISAQELEQKIKDSKVKKAEAEEEEAEEEEEEEDSSEIVIPAYYYFDITLKNDKFGIEYRQQPYTAESAGMGEIDTLVSNIRKTLESKVGKDSILSLTKRYADVAVGRKTSRKSDKKAIQEYMEKEFRKIQGGLNQKSKLPNIPRRHIKKVKELAKNNYISLDNAFNIFSSNKADNLLVTFDKLMGIDIPISLEKEVENIVMANVKETMTQEQIDEFVEESSKKLEETIESIKSKIEKLNEITGKLDSESFVKDIKNLILLAEKIEKSEDKLKRAYELLDEQIETVEAEKDMAPSQKTPKTDEKLYGQSLKTKNAFSTLQSIGNVQDELFDSIEELLGNELLSGFWGKYEEVFNALKNPKSGLSIDEWLAKVNKFKDSRKGFYKLFEIDVDSLEDIKLNTERIVNEIEELQDSIANGGTYVVDKQLEEIETMILSAVALTTVKQITGNESILQQGILDAVKKVLSAYELSTLQGQRIGGKEWLKSKASPQKSRLQSERLSSSEYAKYLSAKYSQFDVSEKQILEFLENKDSVKDKLEENKESKEED
jgi:hypothetical protein